MKHKTKGLTEREIDVLKFVILGYNNKTIGKKLFITNHTVKAHLTQIYKKLGVTNRTAAAIKAKDNNIIPPQDSEIIFPPQSPPPSHKSFLRNFYTPDRLHTFFTFLLLFQKLSLTRNISAVTFI